MKAARGGETVSTPGNVTERPLTEDVAVGSDNPTCIRNIGSIALVQPRLAYRVAFFSQVPETHVFKCAVKVPPCCKL